MHSWTGCWAVFVYRHAVWITTCCQAFIVKQPCGRPRSILRPKFFLFHAFSGHILFKGSKYENKIADSIHLLRPSGFPNIELYVFT